jgi:hypothetical protein
VFIYSISITMQYPLVSPNTQAVFTFPLLYHVTYFKISLGFFCRCCYHIIIVLGVHCRLVCLNKYPNMSHIIVNSVPYTLARRNSTTWDTLLAPLSSFIYLFVLFVCLLFFKLIFFIIHMCIQCLGHFSLSSFF